MPGHVKRISRTIVCPECKERTEVLIEWTTVKGKKTLCQIDCSNAMLSDFGVEDCTWTCWERLSHKD